MHINQDWYLICIHLMYEKKKIILFCILVFYHYVVIFYFETLFDLKFLKTL